MTIQAVAAEIFWVESGVEVASRIQIRTLQDKIGKAQAQVEALHFFFDAFCRPQSLQTALRRATSTSETTTLTLPVLCHYESEIPQNPSIIILKTESACLLSAKFSHGAAYRKNVLGNFVAATYCHHVVTTSHFQTAPWG